MQRLIAARKQEGAKNVSPMGTAKRDMIVMTLNACGWASIVAMIRNVQRIGFVQTTSAFSDVIRAMLIVVRRRHTVARKQEDAKSAGLVSSANGGRNVSGITVSRERIMRNAYLVIRSMVKDAEMAYGSTWNVKAQRSV